MKKAKKEITTVSNEMPSMSNEMLFRQAIIKQRIRRANYIQRYETKRKKSKKTEEEKVYAHEKRNILFILKNGVYYFVNFRGEVIKSGLFFDFKVKPPVEPLVTESEHNNPFFSFGRKKKNV